MVHSAHRKAACLFLALVLILPLVSCGGGRSLATTTKRTTTAPVFTQTQLSPLITGVVQAAGDVERITAVQALVASGFSLGVRDYAGSQRNPNLSKDALSLGQDDLAILASLAEEGSGRTLGSVVEYLTGAGAVLAATGQPVTFSGILPDIERYMRWSFAHANDPRALLGLLLASGAEMVVPAAPPVLSENTVISPTAAMMMVADVMLGVDKPVKTRLRSAATEVVYAAYEQSPLDIIEGLLTLIKPFEPELAKKGIVIPDYAKKMVAAFQAGNSFAVRLVDTNTMPGSPARVKQFELGRDQTKNLTAVVILVGTGEIVKTVPFKFSLNLISPFTGLAGALLYDDADAMLVPLGAGSAELNGHRLGMIGNQPASPAGFTVLRTLMENKIRKAAFLYAMADIQAPDIAAVLKGYQQVLDKMGEKSILLEASLPMEKVRDLYLQLQMSIKVASTACVVGLPGLGPNITVQPVSIQGETGKEYTFTAKLDPPDTGAMIFWFQSGAGAGIALMGLIPAVLESGYQRGETYKAKWDRAGTYSIVAAAYIRDENRDWKLASSASAQAVIQLKSSILRLDFDVKGLFSTLEPLSFTGKCLDASWPTDAGWQWKWDWGDGTPPSTSVSTPNGSHRYTSQGKYTVLFSVVSDRTVVGTCQKDVIIEDINILKTMNVLRVGVWGFYMEEFGTMKGGVFNRQGGSGVYAEKGKSNNVLWPLKWEGYHFSAEKTETDQWGCTQTTRLEGTVAYDTLTVDHCVITMDLVYPDYEGPGKTWTQHTRLEVTDMPLYGNRTVKTFWGEVKGDKVPASFVSYEYISTVKNGSPDGDKVTRFVKFDWANISQGAPRILVEFRKD